MGFASSFDSGDYSLSVGVENPNNPNLTFSTNNHHKLNIVVIFDRVMNASDESFFSKSSCDESSHAFFYESDGKSTKDGQTNNATYAPWGIIGSFPLFTRALSDAGITACDKRMIHHFISLIELDMARTPSRSRSKIILNFGIKLPDNSYFMLL